MYTCGTNSGNLSTGYPNTVHPSQHYIPGNDVTYVGSKSNTTSAVAHLSSNILATTTGTGNVTLKPTSTTWIDRPTPIQTGHVARLSNNDDVGIAIGGGAFIIAMAIGMYVLHRKYKKAKGFIRSPQWETPAPSRKASMPGINMAMYNPGNEHSGIAELGGENQAFIGELQGSQVVAEPRENYPGAQHYGHSQQGKNQAFINELEGSQVVAEPRGHRLGPEHYGHPQHDTSDSDTSSYDDEPNPNVHELHAVPRSHVTYPVSPVTSPYVGSRDSGVSTVSGFSTASSATQIPQSESHGTFGTAPSLEHADDQPWDDRDAALPGVGPLPFGFK